MYRQSSGFSGWRFYSTLLFSAGAARLRCPMIGEMHLVGRSISCTCLRFVLPLTIGRLPTRIRAIATGRTLGRHRTAAAAPRTFDRLAMLAFVLTLLRSPHVAVGLLAFARAVGHAAPFRVATTNEKRAPATRALLRLIA